MPPGLDLGALKPSPIRNHRCGQPRCAAGTAPWCSSRIGADCCSRPASGATANSRPTASSVRPAAKILPASELARHRAPGGAGLRLIWPSRTRRAREVDQADRRKTVGPRGRSGSSSGSRSHQATSSRSRSSSSTGRLVASASTAARSRGCESRAPPAVSRNAMSARTRGAGQTSGRSPGACQAR